MEAAAINRNKEYLNFRGSWTVYVLIVAAIHLFFLSLEFLTTEWAWTLTVLSHSAITFVVFHITKGVPWIPLFANRETDHTVWEQLDDGAQETPTKKFLITVPIVLFFLGSFYTHHDKYHFILNLIALGLAIIPKMPQLYGVRIFNINRW